MELFNDTFIPVFAANTSNLSLQEGPSSIADMASNVMKGKTATEDPCYTKGGCRTWGQ